MKAVILAAGQGTRMRPLTDRRPKVMLPIGNKPILEHIIDEAMAAGIREFVIVTGYMEDCIKDYFGDGSQKNVSIDYVLQEEQNGTGHAIGCAEEYVDDRFIVLNGDMLISSVQIKNLIDRAEDAVLTVKEVENPCNFGVVCTAGEKVTQIVEKPENPPTNLANAGIYLFPRSIFDYIHRTPESPRGEIEITDSIQMLIDSGAIVGYEVFRDAWIDIGRPWDLLTANKHVLAGLTGNIEAEVEPNATLKGEVVLGEGTIIRNGAYIIGPVIIGKNCDIGPNCFIRPSTAIGDNVRIGNAVEIKNCVVMNNTNIGHLSYVGDSVIGRDCNFGAGTKVANLRHDGRTIRVMVKGEKVDSGRRKLGVIMGDNVHTGINTCINVGCVLKTDRCTGLGEVVK
ncbi:bifunctional sugar-1-phosphate nucleotidylyltransferase/acetyltransferase [Methanohalophilus portucalensis]|uniref:Bifunctional protein GlmU n=3 Tax=Methanohalophilus portucalensis TaxID=39664 RepID=A0A1X7NEH0_9EURY|nr:bifunctional sugar-1-phosphate nucleotidylyltransferase/acetyltransferase [Methanohalophilus portucalensis]ATU09261.1 glucose-1-phosphate thymidylyltransferase [Methanohalophilus portucalensis]RNI13677.1 glucose-1-phosphate thymidylyltransferase [Methanohalophilus portucalensis FDF-1]SMH35685.1 bifunctional UDP-N-acetylglucosamine pyrophosphorylase / Glucosamine-1-phosphate N-acetyltransferase [Methanohalophilus portucalensis FDF-1]